MWLVLRSLHTTNTDISDFAAHHQLRNFLLSTAHFRCCKPKALEIFCLFMFSLYFLFFLSSLMGLQVWSSLQVQRCNPDYLHWTSFQQSSTGFLCHCMEDYRGLSGCSCHGWGQYFDSYVENHDIVSATDVRIWGEQIKYEFQKLSVRNCFTEACEMFRFAICRWKTLYMYINNFSFFWPF